MTSFSEPRNVTLEWEDILLDNESGSQDTNADNQLDKDRDNPKSCNVNGESLFDDHVKSNRYRVNCDVGVNDRNNYDHGNDNGNYNGDDDDDNDTLYCEDTASEYRTPPGSPKLFYSSDETLNQSSPYYSDIGEDKCDYDFYNGPPPPPPPSTTSSSSFYRSNSIGGCNEALKAPYRKQTRSGSLVDQLLNDIQFALRKTEYQRRYSRGSDTSSLSPPDFTYRMPLIRRAALLAKDICELQLLLCTLECDIKRMNTILLHHLKKKDKLHFQRGQFFDIITAALQAISPKRRVDTKMRFSIEPIPGDSGFNQWHDAMRMVARLPGGIPNEFRKKLWLTLSERFVESRNINWHKTSKFCFNEKCNPEDDSLGTQIVKDLHRTGCSLFSGEDSEHNQALLKQVLLAFARWNRGVGYCQGFNMLAAIILEVMNWDVDNSLKVMIYLIEGVLPTSYFANNLRGLSVDMAAFRDLLRLRLPELSKHLDKLQNEAQDLSTGASYEPPLVNVFTMQWFLTLFSNCLPKPLVLRIWDLIFLEGNEILIRTALAIWDCLQDRIINVESADEFYSIMGVLTREMMEFGVRDTNELVKTICTMAPFPFPQLADFREKYTFNIRPLTSLVKKGVNLFYSDEEEDDSTTDPIMVASWCLSNAFNGDRCRERSGSRATSPSTLDGFSNSLSMIGSTIGTNSTNFLSSANIDSQRMSLDISLLKKQYMKLKERQRQAHIILIEGFQNAQTNSVSRKQSMTVNHLLQGKTALIAKRPRKPCSVRQPTTGGLVGGNGPGSGPERCPSTKKCLSERSKTVANLDPLLQAAKNCFENQSTGESGETLHWTDLRNEKKKNRLARKLSEPSLSICRESSIEGLTEDSEEPEVAFIEYSTSTSSSNAIPGTLTTRVKRFEGPKKESSVDSDEDEDDQVSSSSSCSKSSKSILSSDLHDDSSSTELCDDVDEDDDDANNNNIVINNQSDVDALPDDNTPVVNDNNNDKDKNCPVTCSLSTTTNFKSSRCQPHVRSSRKLKHKKRSSEISTKCGNEYDSESDISISAKNCLNNSNKKIWKNSENLDNNKVINVPTNVYPNNEQLNHHNYSNHSNHQPQNSIISCNSSPQFNMINNETPPSAQLVVNEHNHEVNSDDLMTKGDQSIDEIKRELSDLSVEQCIQKLNEKISSLSSN